jgi:hypothetical protein
LDEDKYAYEAASVAAGRDETQEDRGAQETINLQVKEGKDKAVTEAPIKAKLSTPKPREIFELSEEQEVERESNLRLRMEAINIGSSKGKEIETLQASDAAKDSDDTDLERLKYKTLREQRREYQSEESNTAETPETPVNEASWRAFEEMTRMKLERAPSVNLDQSLPQYELVWRNREEHQLSDEEDDLSQSATQTAKHDSPAKSPFAFSSTIRRFNP